MKSIPLLLLILVLTPRISAQIVSTQFGQVQGTMNGSIYQFLGIPFAKPPVNDLRWKAPENPDNWSGILATNAFAPVCPQKHFDQGGVSDTIIGNEDCLYLNIWSPQLNTGTLPVMVFIHGGGNQQGGASEQNGGTYMFFGKNLSERGDVVVVTIQYRLGPLGFLVHPGLEPENAAHVSGNYAAMDQILALNWIRNNITAFGGDTSRVMIFGESAGGVNVGNLMNAPAASGLFQRACIESAGPVLAAYETGRNNGISYANSFGVTGTDLQKIAQLRALPSDSLVSNEDPPLSGGAVGMNWQSVVDGVVFTDFPYTNFQNGTFNKVPFMIGTNSEEMSLSAPQTVYPAMVNALINNTVPSALQSQATALYPPGSNTTQARESYVGILTDAQFTATARRTAQCISTAQPEPVWRYFFTHKHTIQALQSLGSYHGMELFYVFNNWENATLGSGPFFGDEDDSVQRVMLRYWVNFAATGNPNGNGLAVWPEYAGATDCYLEIKAQPNGSQCGLRTAQCDLWDEAVGFVPCTDNTGITENVDAGQMMAFPNPVLTQLYLHNVAASSVIACTDILGKVVFSGLYEEGIDVSGWAPGMYHISLSGQPNAIPLRILKL